jgi:hypothetical protein
MGKFGTAVKTAVYLLRQRKVLSPRDAWLEAVERHFPSSPTSQEKGCPRDAFLGLCEEGLVRGVSAGSYTRSEKNKRYAVDAIKLLKKEPELARSESVLWSRVLCGENKAPNAQMDVVISLWREDFIADC